MDAKDRQTLTPVRPNEGIRVAYQRRLEREINAMSKDVTDTVLATYRRDPPEMAQDESPAMALRRVMRALGRKWLKRFDELSGTLAEHFAKDAADRSDKALQAALRKAGFTVRFQSTRATNDAMQAIIGENVSLIKSIPGEYLTQVSGQVMRSVARGRDLGGLAAELQAQHGVTKRRAALIARDQNNKATAAMTRVRQTELGITQAKWLHTGGGKEPRQSHVDYSGKLYDINRGALIDGDYIFPGELINCRCVSVSIVPGFDD